MKRSLFSLFTLFIFLFAAISLAQTVPEPSAAANSSKPASPATILAAGTTIPVELSKSVDAKKSKANDKIEAKTSMDLLSHGQIVVPRNTKIIGHVTEVKARSKSSPDSMVGISFDRMLMKDGREIPLQSAVQAIARPLQTGVSLRGSESIADTAAGIPSAAQGSRGSSTGIPSSPTPYPYPSAHPTAGGTEISSDPMRLDGSTVSPLSPASQGVVGMRGLSLKTSGQASVLSSNTDNVHLDSGTQLILRVQ